MSDEPTRAVHPTIYHVVLGHRAAQQFDASPEHRTAFLKLFSGRARALGKRSVEVMGPYCRLAQVDVGGEL